MPRARQLPIVHVLLAVPTLWLAACPNQELASLAPCTVSAASIDATQNGIDKVDVLFVVDNSGSMSQEQIKLSKQLPRLVSVLATGDLDGVANANGQPDFTPVSSLHLGVVSSDLAVNGQVGVRSCGDQSFLATELDTGAVKELRNKPHGDEGRLLHSSDVSRAGVNIQRDGHAVQAIAPRPECEGVNVDRFLDVELGKSDPAEIARKFSCIAELGVNGCGFEQQLESMWRALAPSSDASFSGGTSGQGGPAGYNAGFLRSDAVLVVILVSDEEDCSSPDASRNVLYVPKDPNVNVLCARSPSALHPVSRYVDGLKSLKPAVFRDRIIFAGIVGVPTADTASGKTLDQLLASPEMQVVEEESVPRGLRASCVAPNGAGRADPARRMVEVAKGFGDNGVITSICEEDYGPALGAVIKKIAEKLTGACLPRRLKVNAQGTVDCTVVEIKAADDRTPCAQTPGRKRALESRTIDGTSRIVCEVSQLPVVNRTEPVGNGWYYDNFSDNLKACKTDKQRVAFAKTSPLSDGALARIECQQSVLNVEQKAVGREAINTPCSDDGSDGSKTGDPTCAALSLPDQRLVCVLGTCQLSCAVEPDCPPAFTCTRDALGRGYCENPTCPISEP